MLAQQHQQDQKNTSATAVPMHKHKSSGARGHWHRWAQRTARAHSALLIALIRVIIVAFSISTVSSSFKFRKSKIIALFQDEPYAPANIHFIFNKHSSNRLFESFNNSTKLTAT